MPPRSLRRLWSDRGAAALASISLALALSAVAVSAHLLDSLFFATPPGVGEPAGLARVFVALRAPGRPESVGPVLAGPAFEDLARCASVAEAAGQLGARLSLGQGAGAEPVRARVVSPGFFTLLRARTALGRHFDELAAGERAGSVILSHALWRSRFGGEAGVLGRSIILDGRVFTVAGVSSPGFRGVEVEQVDLWLPWSEGEWLRGAGALSSRGGKLVQMLVRLQPGVSRRQAEQALTLAYRRGFAGVNALDAAAELRLGSLQAGRAPAAPLETRVTTWLAALSGLILLAAAASLGHLLLARALDRRREVAIAQALGAPASTATRLVAAEAAILVTVAVLAALVLQPLATAALRELPGSPALLATARAGRGAIATTLAAAAMALFVSLVPAAWAARRRPASLARASRDLATPATSRVLAGLLAAQIAAAAAFLVAAGLFGRDLQRLRSADRGFDAATVLAGTVDLRRAGIPRAETGPLWEEMASRVGALAGVEAVALASTIPFESVMSDAVFLEDGTAVPELAGGGPYLNAVSPGFARALGLRLLSGRFFEAADGATAPAVAVVNETLARLAWPAERALDREIRIGEGEGARRARVVGVVADTARQSLREEPAAQVYVPLGQGAGWLGPRALFVRVRSEPRAMAAAVRGAMQSASPRLPHAEVRGLRELIDPKLRAWRLSLSLFGALAVIAGLLAVAGLYAAVARAVRERERELAVRVALGAAREQIVRRILARTAGLALAGIAAGVPLAALALARWAAPLLQSTAWDARVLLGVVALTLAASLLAGFLPARRVLALDPALVLRRE